MTIDSELRSGYVDTDEASIFHIGRGGGTPVVLVHGGFQTWRCWRRVIPYLAERHAVVALDLRGVGRSTAPTSRFDQSTLAADVAAVMTRLGHERFHIVGHDLGAAVATSVAAEHPRRVTSLMFLEYLLCGFGFEEALVPRPDNHHLWFAALNMVPAIPEMLVAGHERDYLTYLARVALTADPEAIDQADLDDYVATYSEPDRWHALCEMFRATWANADLNRRIAESSRIEAPALALGGEFSAAGYCADSLRAVADDVTPGVVSGAAHWLPEERPEELAELLIDFMARSDRA